MVAELISQQDGIVSRSQARAYGVTDAIIAANLAARRWRRVGQGVYATFTGALSRRARLWAAVLRAGPGAILSHESAAEVIGLAGPQPRIHVTVAHSRTPCQLPGIVLHRSRRVDTARHPTRLPPQTTVEETVLDLVHEAACLDDAIGWLAKAVGARLTTTQRLSAAMWCRSRLRWRAALQAALRDVSQGCHSLLELKYLRDVERAHDLPTGSRQVPSYRQGRRTVDDVVYSEHGVAVELDGRAAHPEESRWRDMRRDNAAVAHGLTVLRYGSADVYTRPCDVAEQVSRVLVGAGWRGRPVRCARPDCVIPSV